MSERKFMFSYRFDGAEYGLDIIANSPEEAKRKLSAMALARYDGEIFATIHVPAGGAILRFWRWLTGRAEEGKRE